jgi:hypothetical protein
MKKRFLVYLGLYLLTAEMASAATAILNVPNDINGTEVKSVKVVKGEWIPVAIPNCKNVNLEDDYCTRFVRGAKQVNVVVKIFAYSLKEQNDTAEGSEEVLLQFDAAHLSPEVLAQLENGTDSKSLVQLSVETKTVSEPYEFSATQKKVPQTLLKVSL